jgi:hypothetical protein
VNSDGAAMDGSSSSLWLQEHGPRLDRLGVPRWMATAVADAVLRAQRMDAAVAAPRSRADDGTSGRCDAVRGGPVAAGAALELRGSLVFARASDVHAEPAIGVVGIADAVRRSSWIPAVNLTARTRSSAAAPPEHEPRHGATLAGGAVWYDLAPLPPGPTGDASFALLPPLLARARHSSTPTHRVAAFLPSSQSLPICVAWPADSSSSCSKSGRAEMTRDYLDGRYSLDAPLLRALQLLPLLPHPARWARAEERWRVRALVQGWGGEEGKRAEGARVRAEAAAAVAGRMPGSASGRQVFLAWMAQQRGEGEAGAGRLSGTRGREVEGTPEGESEGAREGPRDGDGESGTGVGMRTGQEGAAVLEMLGGRLGGRSAAGAPSLLRETPRPAPSPAVFCTDRRLRIATDMPHLFLHLCPATFQVELWQGEHKTEEPQSGPRELGENKTAELTRGDHNPGEDKTGGDTTAENHRRVGPSAENTTGDHSPAEHQAVSAQSSWHVGGGGAAGPCDVLEDTTTAQHSQGEQASLGACGGMSDGPPDVLWLGEHVSDFDRYERWAAAAQAWQPDVAAAGARVGPPTQPGGGSHSLPPPPPAPPEVSSPPPSSHLCPPPILNQFPHESVLTSKNLLAECLAAAHSPSSTAWLPQTFTLPQHLPQLVRAFHADSVQSGGRPQGAVPHHAPGGETQEHGAGGQKQNCAGKRAQTSQPLPLYPAEADAEHAPRRRPSRPFLLKPWSSSRSRGLAIASDLPSLIAAGCFTEHGPRIA